MSWMRHEDRLRELELLPMWQMRERVVQPETRQSQPSEATLRHEEDQAPSLAHGVADSEMAQIQRAGLTLEQPASAMQSLRTLISDDARYVILLEPFDEHLGADAEQLLNNMLRAMRIQTRKEVVDVAENLFAGDTLRVIICLGEGPANWLLKESRPLQQWRDAQHETQAQYRGVPLIVTYSPAHLLAQTADKASTWRDLCLAMSLAQAT